MTHDTMNDNNINNKFRGRIASQDPNKIDKAGRTKIFYFTSSGSLEKVKESVERGADVNHKDHAGWTPLHEAAIKGQYEVAKYLINCGAIVNARGFEDDTPLHDACSYGFFDCVQLLVDSGANIYALNTEKQTPLDVCDDEKCIQIMKAKMKELEELASVDKHGRTSLHRSCIDGSLENVKELLKLGANVNATDNFLCTPLHCAAQYGHLSVVEALIKNGADMNSLDSNNSTVLHTACQHSHQSIAQYLIDSGANVHAQDKDEQSPYQVASSVAIRQLITAFIDEEKRQRATTEAIDEITFVSNTKQKRISKASKEDSATLSREERKIQAIMRSFEKAEKSQQLKKTKKDKTVNTIRKKKIGSRQSSRECSVEENTVTKRKPAAVVDLSKLDPYKKDTSGRTQLFKWSIRGHIEAVETLLKAGANPSEKDNAGYTALHEAALAGKIDVVRILLENNADSNSKGADLDTPLHDAAENGYPEIVKLLLDYGADIHIKNSKGQTPLDIAEEEEDKEITKMLKQYKPVKQKKRRLVLAADMSCKQLQSPVSPVSFENVKTETYLKDAKAHARQLSGQHLPKKSLKNLQIVKTEVPFDGYQPLIPTPPPDHWSRVIKKEEEELMELYDERPNSHYPSVNCASKFLPLYTIQQYEGDNSSSFHVADIQVGLLLGISTEQILKQYPHLSRRKVSEKEKERLWSPLSPMICTGTPLNDDEKDKQREVKETEKQKFLEKEIYFIRLDQVVSIIKNDYSHLSEILITITLDIGYQPSSNDKEYGSIKQKTSNVKLPPKFAMKMRKCGMLSKFDDGKNTP
ncbi:hos4 protein [Rhizopus stolonifer]|uniref:Hos4 protein n=1 Tax=Rhizopus stolonifer TaxID=4846 RepID=A0A367K7T3_RHIST|nr:hos4 protein [Rhizopus stolonifer]